MNMSKLGNYKKCSTVFCFLFCTHQLEDEMMGTTHYCVVSNSVLQRTVLITNFSGQWNVFKIVIVKQGNALEVRIGETFLYEVLRV